MGSRRVLRPVRDTRGDLFNLRNRVCSLYDRDIFGRDRDVAFHKCVYVQGGEACRDGLLK